MIHISPISNYLAKINAYTIKENKYINHFFSPEGTYVGSWMHFAQDNKEYDNINIYTCGFKRLYTQCSITVKKFVCLENRRKKDGFDIVPSNLMKKDVFVDHTNNTTHITETEESLENELSLLAYNEKYDVGLYNAIRPLKYNSITKRKDEFANVPNMIELSDIS